MDISLTKMHMELRRLGQYQSYLISRYFMLFFLFLGIIHYYIKGSPSTSLYLFLFIFVSPSILSFIFKKHAQNPHKKETSITVDTSDKTKPILFFPSLNKKYHFTTLKYNCQMISFFISVFLLFLWQISILGKPFSDTFSNQLPGYLLLSSVLIRIFSSIFYRIKFHFDLWNNRL